MMERAKPVPLPLRRRVRQPPAWMSPAQKQAFEDARRLERFLRELLADEKGVTVLNWFSYNLFAKKDYSILHKVKDEAKQKAAIDLRISDWAERGLEERVLRRIAEEIRKAIQNGTLR